MSQNQLFDADRLANKRDYYAELIEGSRWLRREQAAARTAWFQALPIKNKAMVVFEFEMLLKGVVCFGNPLNHPGAQKNAEPAAQRDYSEELSLVRNTLQRIVTTGRLLSASAERATVFHRYLESVIAQDEERFSRVKRSLTQDTPSQSLALLLSTLQNLLEMLEGLTRLVRVPYPLFKGLIQLIELQLHHSVFFNPLAVLEFRTEFDNIQSKRQLELLRGINSDPARRVTAITFLAMSRLLRYLEMIERSTIEEIGLGPMLAWFAVLRSDARALVVFFKRDTAKWMSDGFAKLYEQLPRKEVSAQFARFETEFKLLRPLNELMASLGDQLKLELRKVFEQQLPSIATIENSEQLTKNIALATDTLRTFLQNAVVLLAREFDPNIEGTQIFENFVSLKARSERLRRDIWMFQQVLRAFILKANDAAASRDQWSGLNTFRFVREFVRYFRTMGYQILRYSDYEQFDLFMGLVDRLREGDVLEVQRIPQLVATCEDFQEFLNKTFDAVSKRNELKGVPFDRKEAARTLKLFLAH